VAGLEEQIDRLVDVVEEEAGVGEQKVAEALSLLECRTFYEAFYGMMKTFCVCLQHFIQ
jgi:hypothetical protein